MTPITYKEAINILGVVEGSLHHAISRGVLTRLPREGVYQRLIKEQVELFRGKRLSLSALNDRDRRIWQQYHDAVTIPTSQPIQSSEMQTAIQQVAQQVTQPEVIAGLVTLGVITAVANNQINWKLVAGAGAIAVALILLFYLLDKASEQEIEATINGIENPTQREAIKSLLEDEETLALLREAVAA